MTNHGRYTNGNVNIQVNEEPGYISYDSANPDYHGYLQFALTNTTHEISTLVAVPERQNWVPS
jgi:hypothetical protein